MSHNNSPDIIQKSFAELNQLRHDSNSVFQTAAEGAKDTLGDEAKEKKFLSMKMHQRTQYISEVRILLTLQLELQKKIN